MKEQIYWLQQVWIFTRQMKTCFSEGKLMKQFGKPLFLRGPPYFWAIFSWPPLCGNFQNKKPSPLILGRGGNYAFPDGNYKFIKGTFQIHEVATTPGDSTHILFRKTLRACKNHLHGLYESCERTNTNKLLKSQKQTSTFSVKARNWVLPILNMLI